MCYRFHFEPDEDTLSYLNIEEVDVPELVPNYNISPRMQTPIIVRNTNHRVLTSMRWGLIPHWAKDEKIGDKTANARIETVLSKPSFKSAVRNHRCLVPASGFFEWQKTEGGGKDPYNISSNKGTPLAFAGIYDIWNNCTSFSILTTEPNSMMRPFHHRMPVVLTSEEAEIWLSEDANLDKVIPSLHNRDHISLRATKISTLVNNPKNNTISILKPI